MVERTSFARSRLCVRRTVGRTGLTRNLRRIPVKTIVILRKRVVTQTRGLERIGRATVTRTRLLTVSRTYGGLKA